MKQFNNFDAFTKHMQKVSAQYSERESKALNFLGKHLENEAKHKIGWLQHGAGPFENWADLAESTKLSKQRKGYVHNSDYNPLYATGELKESIHYSVVLPKHAVFIGSASDIALYQEFGTSKIPARSFLGLTMFKEKYQIQHILGSFLLNWITGSQAALKRR